jgi:hypothetical protein
MNRDDARDLQRCRRLVVEAIRAAGATPPAWMLEAAGLAVPNPLPQPAEVGQAARPPARPPADGKRRRPPGPAF